MNKIDFSNVYSDLYRHIFTNDETVDPEKFTTSTVGVTGNGIIREKFLRQYLKLKESDTNHFDGILPSGRYSEIKTSCRTDLSDKGKMTFSLIEDRVSLYRKENPLLYFSDFTQNGKCIYICSVEYECIREKFEKYYRKKELIKEATLGKNKYFVMPSGSWIDYAKLEFANNRLLLDIDRNVFPGNSILRDKLLDLVDDLKGKNNKRYKKVVIL